MRIGWVMCAIGAVGCWHGEDAAPTTPAPVAAAPARWPPPAPPRAVEDDPVEEAPVVTVARPARRPHPTTDPFAAMNTPCPNPPDVNNPACGLGRSRALGRIIQIVPQDRGAVVTIGVGATSGVAMTWSAWLCEGDHHQRVEHGDLHIFRVDKGVTFATSELPPRALQVTSKVCLIEP